MFFRKITTLILFLLISFSAHAFDNLFVHWYGDSPDSKTAIDIHIPESFWIKAPNPDFPTQIKDKQNNNIPFKKIPTNRTLHMDSLQLILNPQEIISPLTVSFLLCNEQICVPNYINLELEKPPLGYNIDHISTSLISILFIAFIGGMILNIMPCVFPVLSLKFTQLLSHQTTKSKTIRKDFLYTALGILSTFLCFSAIIQTVKLMGNTIGWGVQFQSPIFILIMSFILVFFILNLLDLKTIFIPQFILDFLNRQTSKSHHPIRSAFLMGVFITLMATPCAAPFIGTAITAAFLLPGLDSTLVFISMGAGFASPFILFSLFPNWIRFLPKPGNWLIIFKKLLSIPIFLTLIWLIYLQFNLNLFYFTLTTLGILMICLSLLKSNKIILISLALILSGGYFFFSKPDVEWINYSSDTLEKTLQNNEYVFINITADWCLTCKINRVFLLESNKVQTLFKRYNIQLIEADWTHANKAVTTLMQQYHSHAVPTYILFTPSHKKGIKLSEIPTYDEISKYIH